MESYRVIKKPKKCKLTISIPENMNDMELEVIVQPVIKANQKKKFNPDRYKGIWKDIKIDVNKMSQEMRSEWERNI